MVDDVLSLQKCSNKSLQMNTAINKFMDLEKLTLSKKKSHNIHIGKQKQNCPSLKVHENNMENQTRKPTLEM